NEYKMEPGSFLEKLWPFLEKKKADILTEDHSQPSDTSPLAATKRYLTRFTTRWQNPIQAALLAALSAHQQQSGFMLRSHQSKSIGIVTHRVIQHLAQLGINWWTGASSQAQRHFLQQQFKQLGMTQDELSDAIETVSQFIHHMLQDPRG